MPILGSENEEERRQVEELLGPLPEFDQPFPHTVGSMGLCPFQFNKAKESILDFVDHSTNTIYKYNKQTFK